MPTTISAIHQPFDEAVAYFRQKTNMPSSHWTTVMDTANTRAFAVAGATSKDLISDFRGAVEKGIAKGTTLAEFKKDFDQIVAKHGWKHTGKAEWRARIIYQTNLSNAFSAGRYAQQTDPAVLAAYPYFEYVHVNCPHPRMQHLAWSGTILRADDPWWSTHYTPNGWGCHCIVMNLGPRDLKRRGIDPDSLKAPPIQWQEYVNRTTGVVTKHPAGIDPGFAYNPGEAWKTGAAQPLTAEPLRPIGPPPPVLAPPGKDAVAPPVLRKFLLDPQGSVQVGRIGGAAQAKLGGEAKPVLFDAEAAKAQLAAHPGLTLSDYAAAAPVLAAPELILAHGANQWRMIARVDERVILAVIEHLKDGTLSMTGLDRLDKEQLVQELRRYMVLHSDGGKVLDWMEAHGRRGS